MKWVQIILYLNVGYRVPFNWTVLYIYLYLYKSFVCCMTLIISTVGRCNHRFAQIDRLIVQVPRIVKEPGIFHILEWSLFHAFRFETGHSVIHVYFCLLRDGCICSVYICVYIMWLCRFWKLWYPVDTPLPHFWVSQWVK